MLKNIFFKIMSDEKQRQKINSLKEKNEIFELFCENGYRKSFDDFEKDMNDFLNSEDGKNLISNNFDELSDDMLEMIAGGVNVKQAITAGIATLLTTFTIGAVGSQILSQNNAAPPSNTDTISISSSTQDDSNFSSNNDNQPTNDNGGQSTNNNSNENKPNGPKTMNNRKGPGGRFRSNTPGRPGRPGGGFRNNNPGGPSGPGGPGGGFRNNNPGGPGGPGRAGGGFRSNTPGGPSEPGRPGGGFRSNTPGNPGEYDNESLYRSPQVFAQNESIDYSNDILAQLRENHISNNEIQNQRIDNERSMNQERQDQQKLELDKNLFNRIEQNNPKEEPGQAAIKTLDNLEKKEIIKNNEAYRDKVKEVHNQRGANRIADILQTNIKNTIKTAMENIKSTAQEQKNQQKQDQHNKDIEEIKNANEANRKIVEEHEKITEKRKEITQRIKDCAPKHKEVQNLLKEINKLSPTDKKIQNNIVKLKSQVISFLKTDPSNISQEDASNYLNNADSLITQMNNMLKKTNKLQDEDQKNIEQIKQKQKKKQQKQNQQQQKQNQQKQKQKQQNQKQQKQNQQKQNQQKQDQQQQNNNSKEQENKNNKEQKSKLEQQNNNNKEQEQHKIQAEQQNNNNKEQNDIKQDQQKAQAEQQNNNNKEQNDIKQDQQKAQAEQQNQDQQQQNNNSKEQDQQKIQVDQQNNNNKEQNDIKQDQQKVQAEQQNQQKAQLERERLERENEFKTNPNKFNDFFAGNQHPPKNSNDPDNTCLVHAITNFKNIQNHIDGSNDEIIKGYKNVINNYNKNKENQDKKLGNSLDLSNIKGFCKNFNVGVYTVNYSANIDPENKEELNKKIEELKKSDNEYQQLLQSKNKSKNELKEKENSIEVNAKEYLAKKDIDYAKNQVKNLLVKYMKGKPFAPIAVLTPGHWILITQYNENTDEITVLDSGDGKLKTESLNETIDSMKNLKDKYFTKKLLSHNFTFAFLTKGGQSDNSAPTNKNEFTEQNIINDINKWKLKNEISIKQKELDSLSKKAKNLDQKTLDSIKNLLNQPKFNAKEAELKNIMNDLDYHINLVQEALTKN